MAVRRERVVLTLEDHFTTEMARAAAATALLDKSLRDLDGSAVRVRQPVREVSRESDGLTRSVDRSASSINQLTGRLRIMADAAAILGPSLVPISAVAVPAVTGLASQLGFAAFGMTSLMAASQGVGDALKAVNEAAIEPTAANLEKAQQAMEQLGPDAQAFVARFQDLRPVLRDIRDAAAEGWFPGLTDSLDSLERVAPKVGSIFEAIGRAGGNLVSEGAAKLAGPEWAEFLSFVENNAPQALDDLGRTIGNVARGLAELWMAFDPLNDSFSSWLLDASRGFAEWADGLSATEGFQEFVDYIRENGPRVADALGALGDALVQIVVAVAPLGGPSLAIIEAFATAVAAIADSDLGTPVLAAVAAYAALNRTLRVTAALQRQVSGQSAIGDGLAAGGVLGGLRGAGRGLTATNRDLRTTAINAGKASAALAGLTIATTGLADGFGLSNTASLALMGTVAGPWGAAIGGGIGLVMDFASAHGDLERAAKNADAALSSGNIEHLNAALREQREILEGTLDSDKITGVGDFFSDIGRGLSGGGSGDLKAATQGRIEELTAAVERAALAEAGFADSLAETGRAAGLTASELLELANSTNDASDAAWNAIDANVRLEQAMADAAEAAKKGKKGLDATTQAGRDNLTQLSNVAKGWEAAQVAMEENGASTRRIERRYQQVRARLIDTAMGMGATREEAVRLANQLSKPMTIVIKERHQEAVANARSAIDQLRRDIEGRPITQTVRVVVNGKKVNAQVGTPGDVGNLLGGQADGGTVLGQRQPYGDKVPTMLAPGEEVISNRRGQADRWRPLLKAINGNRLADGGTVSPARPVYVPPSSGAITVATDPAILARLAAIESAVNRSSAVTRDEHATDRASQRSGASVAAMSKSRGYLSR